MSAGRAEQFARNEHRNPEDSQHNALILSHPPGSPSGGSPLAYTQYQQDVMRVPSCMQREEYMVMDQNTKVNKNPDR